MKQAVGYSDTSCCHPFMGVVTANVLVVCVQNTTTGCEES